MRNRCESACVVIDGMSLFYSLAVDIIRKGAPCMFSYPEVRKEIFKFMDYLTAKNIVVKCVCLDALFDPDKISEYGKRVYERGQDVQVAWDNYFRYGRNQYRRF